MIKSINQSINQQKKSAHILDTNSIMMPETHRNAYPSSSSREERREEDRGGEKRKERSQS